jgi:hypothetical protein
MRAPSFILALLFALLLPDAAQAAGGHDLKTPEFVERMKDFAALRKAPPASKASDARLAFRAKEQPFLLVATIIFVLAILHTFVAIPITKLAHKVQHDHDARIRKERAAHGESTHAE